MDIFSLIPQFGSALWTVAAFIVVISVIVAIHEYGHYIVGRWCGIKADVFSLGFGKVLWSGTDRHGTRWQVAALPFGGYVKFAGDANAASGKDDAAMAEAAVDPVRLRETMHGAPLWARTLTVAAGPVFNFALSILIFGAVILSSGVQRDPLTIGEMRPLPVAVNGLEPGDEVLAIAGMPLPGKDAAPDAPSLYDNLPELPELDYTVRRDGVELVVPGPYLRPPLVVAVSPQSAALDAGLREGDVITAVDGTPIFAFDQLKSAVEGGNGDPLALTVWRDGAEVGLTLSPKRVDEPQPDGGFATQWRIGVAGGMAFEPATSSAGIGEALAGGAAQTWRVISGSLSALGHMLTGGISTCNLSGPIGIAKVSGETASQGIGNYIWFIAVISTAIGMMNLFPIPVLDGGHLVFYAYEAVRGQPPSDRVMQVLMSVGLALVLSMMLLGVGNDLLFCR